MKTSRSHCCRTVLLAILVAVSADLVALEAVSPPQGADPASDKAALAEANLSCQYEAMGKYPELARAGSPFHREFLARVQSYRAVDGDFFQNTRWPVVLADEVAAAGFPAVAGRTIPGRPPQANSREILASGPEWRFLKVYREGNDIVVPNAIATVFGWDTKLGVYDPDDNGKCASGRGTRNNPGLMGCALPVSIACRSTAGSPFSRVQNLQWFAPVVVTHKGRSITVQLIDNGPSAPVPNDSTPAGIDLTPAACVALGIPLDDIRNNRLAINVSYRLPGGAL